MVIGKTVEWFNTAKPNPTLRNLSTQIGCHLEEIAELFESGLFKKSEMGLLVDILKMHAKQFKEDKHHLNANMTEKERIEVLDALCDQIVTGTGVGVFLGMDMEGGLNEVNNSNHSKFIDGKPLLDENGKIMKGSNYYKPELHKFV